MEAAHFPKEPAHTGLPYSIDCRKRKKIHWKSQNWRAVWIFEWFKPWLNVLKDEQSRELRRIRTTCPAVNLCTYHWFAPGWGGGGSGNPGELDFVKRTWVGILTSTTIPGVGNLTRLPSWKVERIWEWVTSDAPSWKIPGIVLSESPASNVGWMKVMKEYCVFKQKCYFMPISALF